MESLSIAPPWVKDPKPGGCAHVVPVGTIKGVIPTLGIASVGDPCHDQAVERHHLGIVFIESEPLTWSCVSEAEAAAFKAWGTANFSSVQIVTVSSPAPVINCPPPVATPTERTALIEQIRDELRRLAPHWFVPATPARRVA